jgi:hypothetical protein
MDLKSIVAAGLLALMVAGAAAPRADAFDGVIPINLSKVIASGGFPYKITVPGSYRLTGNLAATGTADAIDVLTAAPVTIDLNGFMISGVIGTNLFGINDAAGALIVRNGVIKGFNIDVLASAGPLLAEDLILENSFTALSTASDSVIVRATFTSSSTAIGGNSNAVVSECSMNITTFGVEGNSLVAVNNNVLTGDSGFGTVQGLAAFQNHVGANSANPVLGVADNFGGAWGRNVITPPGVRPCAEGPVSLGDNVCRGARQ